MNQTRDTFAGLSTWELVLWYVLIAISTSIFLWGSLRLILKYRRGRAPGGPRAAPPPGPARGGDRA